jgi:hypothetical protein
MAYEPGEPDEDEDRDRDLEVVKVAVARLMEHFDTVHIFATRHEKVKLDGTVNVQTGEGNWFTRYGQVRHWMLAQDGDAHRFLMKPDGD